MLSPKLLISFLFPLSLPWSCAWQPLGSSAILGKYPSLRGSTADLSEDGRRLLVGDPGYRGGNGAVRLFQLDTSGDSWKLLVEIHGDKNEGFGRSLSLSPDGQMIAVRRNHMSPNGVQTYQVFGTPNSVFHYHPMGPLIQGPANGTELSLTQIGAEYFLLSSYEEYDFQRGMVQVYQMTRGAVLSLTNGTTHWKPYLSCLVGAERGDRFGHAAHLVAAPIHDSQTNIALWMAVGSPYRDSRKGAAQVFSEEAHGWAQQGVEMVGSQLGEEFGHALASASGSVPLLVVGSPFKKIKSHRNTTGVVRVFRFQNFESGTPAAWELVAEEAAQRDHKSFGRAVAVSRDGRRFAVSSKSSDAQIDQFHILETNDYNSWEVSGKQSFDNSRGSVVAISMNSKGSVVSIVFSQDVSAWIDDRPFCRIPVDESATSNKFDDQILKLDAYIDKAECENGVDILTNKLNCELTMTSIGDELMACEWESRTLGTTMESSLPSHSVVNATAGSPRAPTLTPTFSPSSGHLAANDTGVDLFTLFPTALPSLLRDESNDAPSVQSNVDIRACQCNKRERCISSELQYGSNLSLCLTIPTPNFSFFAIAELSYNRGEDSVAIVDHYVQPFGQKVVETCQGHRCTLEMLVPAKFFNRTTNIGLLEVSGIAAIVPSISKTLRGTNTSVADFVSFKTTVKLTMYSRGQEAVAGKQDFREWAKMETTVTAWVGLAAVLAIGILALYFCFGEESSKEADESTAAITT